PQEMDPERQKRREDISKAMSFIKSSLPFPEPESYEAFLTQLVCHLLDEGNSCYRDGDWQQATQQYSEGISVARYAQAEALVIPHELLECLYVNRAAAFYQTREYEHGVQDCDSALCVSEGSRRALYRKALCLRETGRFREAYECGTRCLLTAPHDATVTELAQDLAKKLGLKGRKAYVSPQAESAGTDGESLGEPSSPAADSRPQMSSNGLEALGDMGPGTCQLLLTATVLSACVLMTPPLPSPASRPVQRPVHPRPPGHAHPRQRRASVLGDDAVRGGVGERRPGGAPHALLGACVGTHGGVQQQRHQGPAGQPAGAHPQGTRTGSEPGTLPIGRGYKVQGAIPTNLPNTAVGLRPPYSSSLPPSSSQLPAAFFSSTISEMPPLEPYSPLSGRDQASTQVQDALGASQPKNGPAGTNLSMLSRNPLGQTHEFRQACHACYSRIGPRVMDYKYQPEAAHRCKRDVLLCRLKNTDDPTWKRIRPRPARNNFLGAFVLCKEVQERQECQYGENCTFAYCQEEIDVWTQERKGALSRELLFDPLGSTERRALSVTRLLQLHMGMFMFLCEECFDSKPRIISKRSKENLAVCSNLTARHPFDDNKCLVHVVRSANVRYSKVRPLHPLCQFDVCRHEVRYGCQREDSCSFAHSVIELKCWVLQQDTGITHEEMVQESKRHWQRLEQNAQKQPKAGASGRGPPLNLKMKFVCGQCWREGQVSEPDKNLKYCTAKARHSWTKERRVLLVKSFEKTKWVVVRPLPFSRTYPQQYDMCVHVMKQKKCHYIGNCSFAHSLEERDVWTYMKNNSLRDMQQMYELWLELTNQNRRSDASAVTPPPEDKQVTLTAEYTESMV
uniref:Zinc finger CCCH-type containing 7B n=1 Tax=Tetraodon nigroviridis TaxID=99883 RepID=H3D5Y1_TETNG